MFSVFSDDTARRLLAPQIQQQPLDSEWRILRALAGFRWIVAVGLAAVFLGDAADDLLGMSHSEAYIASAIGLGLLAIGATATLEMRRPHLGWQAVFQTGADVSLLGVLTYATGGMIGSLAALMVVPVVTAGLLVNRRLAAGLAAYATLVLLSQEAIALLGAQSDARAFTLAGVTGFLLFVATLVASAMGSRARAGEALARRVGGDLRSLSRLNESIIARMRAGAIVLNADGLVALANPAAQRLLQLEGAVRDRPLSSLCPPLDRQLESWREDPEQPLAPFDARGGRSVIPQFVTLGVESSQLLITLEDATAMSEHAQQLKLAAVGRLSASIAHEIRNPLAAISHAGQLLGESDGLAADDQELVKIIGEHSVRIDEIVRSVLSLSGSGTTSVPETIVVKAWLAALADQFVQGVPDLDVSVDLATVPDDVFVTMDAMQLRRLVLNLWMNSTHYAAINGTVSLHVGAELSPDAVRIDFWDSGPGVADAAQNKLFEPFYTTSNAGTGLGLFIASELARDNGSTLALIPRAFSDHAGAHFRLTVPRRRAGSTDAQPSQRDEHQAEGLSVRHIEGL